MSLVGDLLKKTIEQDGLLIELPVDEVRISDQPRRYFDRAALEELAESIRRHGVLEPVLVTREPDGGYRLVAGERRYLAARMAGQKTVPAVVRNLPPEELEVVALIENLLREDLSLYEEAEAILKLLAHAGGWTPEEAARQLRRLQRAKDRGRLEPEDPALAVVKEVFAKLPVAWYTFATYHLRALRLPEDLRRALEQGEVSFPVARLLARVKDAKVRGELLAWVVKESPSKEEIRARVAGVTKRPERPAARSVQELARVARRVPPERAEEAERILAEARAKLEALLGEGG